MYSHPQMRLWQLANLNTLYVAALGNSNLFFLNIYNYSIWEVLLLSLVCYKLTRRQTSFILHFLMNCPEIGCSSEIILKLCNLQAKPYFSKQKKNILWLKRFNTLFHAVCWHEMTLRGNRPGIRTSPRKCLISCTKLTLSFSPILKMSVWAVCLRKSLLTWSFWEGRQNKYV